MAGDQALPVRRKCDFCRTSDLTRRASPTNRSAEPDFSHFRAAGDSPHHFPQLFKGPNDVAKPELGIKRQCQSCSAKFFDLNRDPIVCPKCATVFQIAASSRPVARAAAADDDADTEAGAVELVSLEDADAGESKDVAAATEGIEIDDDAAPDETFLEEEEGEADDVADLIDSDIGEDEET